jgi:trimeric autotransporter adhesin
VDRLTKGNTCLQRQQFRRVALVAVAALGLGVLSVAPQASAAATAVTTTVSTTSATLLGTVDAPFASGSAIALNVTASFGTAMVSGDTATITYAVYNPKGETITGVTLVETSTTVSLLGDGTDTGTVKAVGNTLEFKDSVTASGQVVATLTIPAAAVTTGGVYQVRLSQFQVAVQALNFSWYQS